MKIIIKPGKMHEHFKITCSHCGCIFLFESGDIYNYLNPDNRFVVCPDCNYRMTLPPNLDKYAIPPEDFFRERTNNDNATN